MQPDGGLVDDPACIRPQQPHGCFGCLGLVFVPGDQDAILQGGDELHGGNARPGRQAGGILDRLAGDTRHLEHAFQTVVSPQDGIVAVEMPAAAQLRLPAAKNDLPV